VPDGQPDPFERFRGALEPSPTARDLLSYMNVSRAETMVLIQRRRRVKNLAVVLAGALLASLGVYNIVLKATWTLLDDGVFWREGRQGGVAGRVAPGGPAARAGVREGDVLLAVDGDEALTPDGIADALAHRQRGERVQYTLLREAERRSLVVTVEPLPQG